MKESAGRREFTLIAFLLLIASVISGCSSSIQMQSALNENNIDVDGSRRDWGSSLNYVKDDNIAFGFKNDKDNLYIGLVTADRSKMMKILTMGMTLWLKTDKSKIGIIFPMKPEPGEFREMRMNGEQDSSNASSRIKNLISERRDIQVINEDDLPLYTEDAEKGPEFKGKLGYEDDQLVCELKIPMRNNKLAERIFDESTDEVKINFVTGKFERNFRGGNMMGRNPGNPDNPGVGFPPGGGRNPGGMGRGRPRMEGMNFEPLDYTIDLKLSK
ncbi:MAG TPA: hypothetical protein VMT35_01740 [Ignavibacteriaceae bacterium]|nr:hypothetical protein [Ignavibacteriaceae bacterium]